MRWGSTCSHCVRYVCVRGLLHVRMQINVGLAKTMYLRCTYGVFVLEITKYTVYTYVYIRFWPTLNICKRVTLIRLVSVRALETKLHTSKISNLIHMQTQIHTHTHSCSLTHAHMHTCTYTPSNTHRRVLCLRQLRKVRAGKG